jgi:hypothetical protein
MSGCAVLCSRFPIRKSEFIWVVEGTDGSAKTLRRLWQRDGAPTSTIIEPGKRRGLGAAFRLGFAAVPTTPASSLPMDADLNHHPEELKRLRPRMQTLSLARGRYPAPRFAAWRHGADGRATVSIGYWGACSAR